jgi:uncharacterized protein (TIGR00297 family)
MFSIYNALDLLRINLLWALVINISLAGLAYAVRFVRGSGVAAGIIFGVVIYCFGGYPAFIVLMFFFFAGTVVSKLGMTHKVRSGGAETRRRANGAASVFGKCTLGAMLAVLIGMAGGLGAYGGRVEPAGLTTWLSLAYVGSLAAALADTCASELGPVYGDTPLLLTTLESVSHGTPGAVSVAGTILGVAGAMLLGLLSTMLGLVDEKAILYLVISSFCASVFESYLLAQWPHGGFPVKQMSNVADTFVGAAVAVLLAVIFGK